MSSKSLIPNTVNRIKIFSRDYPVLKKLGIFVIVLQGVSLWTEYIGFNSYLRDLLIANGVAWQTASYFAAGGAFFLSLTIEFLFAVLIIFIVECMIDPSYVNKSVILTELTTEYKDKGLISDDNTAKPKVDVSKIAISIHIANWIKLLSALLVLIAIATISITVSKQNVEHAIRVNPTAPVLIDLEPLYEKQANALRGVENRYANQELKIRQQYSLDTAAIYARYKGDLDAQKAEIEKLKARQDRDGSNYKTSIARSHGRIANVYKKIGPELQNRTTLLDTELKELFDKRDKAYGQSETSIREKIQEAEQENRSRIQNKDAQNEWMAMVLKRYSQWATIFALICWVWITLSKWTSGMEKEPRVKPEEFSTSIWEDSWTLITVGPTRLLQNGVRVLLSKIRTLRPLPYQGANYDIETLHEIHEKLKVIEKTNSFELLDLEIKSIRNKREKGVERRRKRGVEKRRWWSVFGRSSTPRDDVDSTDSKSVDGDDSTLSLGAKKSVDDKSVDDPDSSVATRSTPTKRGVDGDGVDDVDSTLTKSVDETDSDTKTKRRVKTKSTPTKSVDGGAGTKRRVKAKTKSVEVDFKVDFGDSTDYQSLYGEVHVNNDTIKIRTVLVENEPKPIWYGNVKDERFVSDQKSNYQRFLDKGDRNAGNNREKIAVATGLLNLLTRHRQALSDNQTILYKK